MPVYKYKTFEEARQALWCLKPDENYFKQISEFFDFASTLCPLNAPRGVFKFQTIEEANKHEDEFIFKNGLEIYKKLTSTKKKSESIWVDNKVNL